MWNQLTVGYRKTNQVVHNTIILDSSLSPSIEKTPPEYQYTVNYNPADQYCLRKCLKNITGPVFSKILQAVQEILPIIQDVHYAVHYITALQVFSMKKTTTFPTQPAQELVEPRRNARHLICYHNGTTRKNRETGNHY